MRRILLLACSIIFCIAAGAQRYAGADISLLPSYEAAGVSFSDSTGRNVDFLPFVSREGWNAVRLRLFVNPEFASDHHKDEGVWQSLDYITPLARRVKEAGMKLMIDFHYSDTWADPGKQFVPKRWDNCNARQLADSIYVYTSASLRHLKENGAEPDFIQVGNEVSYGMLWPSGRVNLDGSTPDSRWSLFSDMLQSGCRACREVCPSAKVIVHIERAGHPDECFLFFDKIRHCGVDYDIVGLSYYPMWHGDFATLNKTLDMFAAEFPSKRVMIVETAYFYAEHKVWPSDRDTRSEFPFSPDGQKEYTRSLVSLLKKHDNVDGLYWWCAEENCYNNKVIKFPMNRGLWDNSNGRALPAVSELGNFAR